MKKVLVFLMCSLLISLVACNNDEEIETTVCGELPDYIRNTTTAAASYTSTTPFTETEIVEYIEESEKAFLASVFPQGSFISGGGYYSVSVSNNEVNLGQYTLFIINGDVIVGSITLGRRGEDVTTVSVMDGWASGTNIDVLQPVLKQYGKGIMIVDGTATCFVTEDNKIHTLHGEVSDAVENAENVYATYARTENTLVSEKVFGSCLVRLSK